MREYLKFYIDGQWVDPVEPKTLDVDNPTTEQVSGKIALGAAADVDKAVKAARKAFATWSQTSREERLDVLQAIAGGVPEARRRSRRRGDRGDGRAAVAGGGPAGRPRPRPPGDGHRRAEELRVRGAARLDADRQGADRRLRADHAVELADQPDRRARCSRRWRPAARWCSSRRRWRRTPRRSSPRSWTPQAFPRACSTWSTATAPASARRCPAIPTSTWCPSPARPAPASTSPRTPPPTVKRVTQELGGKSPNIVLDDEDFAESVDRGRRRR